MKDRWATKRELTRVAYDTKRDRVNDQARLRERDGLGPKRLRKEAELTCSWMGPPTLPLASTYGFKLVSIHSSNALTAVETSSSAAWGVEAGMEAEEVWADWGGATWGPTFSPIRAEGLWSWEAVVLLRRENVSGGSTRERRGWQKDEHAEILESRCGSFQTLDDGREGVETYVNKTIRVRMRICVTWGTLGAHPERKETSLAWNEMGVGRKGGWTALLSSSLLPTINPNHAFTSLARPVPVIEREIPSRT
jgi:hypothetical protein